MLTDPSFPKGLFEPLGKDKRDRPSRPVAAGREQSPSVFGRRETVIRRGGPARGGGAYPKVSATPG